MNLDKNGLTVRNDISKVTYTNNGVVFQTLYNTDKQRQRTKQLEEDLNAISLNFSNAMNDFGVSMNETGEYLDSLFGQPPLKQVYRKCDEYSTNITILHSILEEEVKISYDYAKIYPKSSDKIGNILKFSVSNKIGILFEEYMKQVIRTYNLKAYRYNYITNQHDIDEDYVIKRLNELLF